MFGKENESQTPPETSAPVATGEGDGSAVDAVNIPIVDQEQAPPVADTAAAPTGDEPLVGDEESPDVTGPTIAGDEDAAPQTVTEVWNLKSDGTYAVSVREP
jgi:hypothetical protein